MDANDTSGVRADADSDLICVVCGHAFGRTINCSECGAAIELVTAQAHFADAELSFIRRLRWAAVLLAIVCLALVAIELTQWLVPEVARTSLEGPMYHLQAALALICSLAALAVVVLLLCKNTSVITSRTGRRLVIAAALLLLSGGLTGVYGAILYWGQVEVSSIHSNVLSYACFLCTYGAVLISLRIATKIGYTLQHRSLATWSMIATIAGAVNFVVWCISQFDVLPSPAGYKVWVLIQYTPMLFDGLSFGVFAVIAGALKRCVKPRRSMAMNQPPAEGTP